MIAQASRLSDSEMAFGEQSTGSRLTLRVVHTHCIVHCVSMFRLTIALLFVSQSAAQNPGMFLKDPAEILSNSTRFMRPADSAFQHTVSDPFAGLEGLHQPLYRDGRNTSHYFNYLDGHGRKLTVHYDLRERDGVKVR